MLSWTKRCAALAALGSVAAGLAGCAQPASDARPLPGDVDAGPGGTGAGESGAGESGAGGSGAGESGAGGSAGGTQGGGGAPPAVPPCAEWSGPFGSAQDDLLDPNLSWAGFVPGELAESQVRLRDHVACGAGDEVQALVIYIDALWCAVCRDVAGDLANRYDDTWRDQGIRVVSLIVEDADANPATLESAWLWRDTFGLHDLPVAIDPEYTLADEHPDALPKVLVVDPRTMRIVARASGDVDLEPLLAQMVATAGE